MRNIRRGRLAAGILVATVFFFGLATCVKAVWKLMTEDPKSGEPHSRSVAEARTKGTLVAELEVTPAELQWHGRTIRFREAWLEERYQVSHRLVWFRYYKRVGGHNLLFTLSREDDPTFGEPEGILVAGDEGASFKVQLTGGEPTLFTQPLTDPDVSTLRVSLISPRQEPRPKNIRFVRKP